MSAFSPCSKGLMRIIIFSALYFLFFGGVAFAESYLCIQDQAIGFVYNKKQKAWEQAQFPSEKFLIKRGGDKPDSFNINFPMTLDSPLALVILKQKMSWPHWYVTPFGEDFPWIRCLDDFAENGDLACDASSGLSFGSGLLDGGIRSTVIHFNRNTLRFLESSNMGYYSQGNDYKPPEPTEWTDASPLIAIGTCSKI